MRSALIAGVLVVAAAVALAFALAMGANDQRELADVTRENCEQIESLKTELRREAIRVFNNFDRNTRILGIEVTPELRAVARQKRDRTLVRFAPIEC